MATAVPSAPSAPAGPGRPVKRGGPAQIGVEDDEKRENRYLYILPVLFYEFLALALARSLLPGMMVAFFGDWCYYAIGIVETVKG